MTQTIMMNNNSCMSRSSAALSSLPMRGHHNMQQPPQQPMEMNRGRADSGSTTFSSSSDTSSSNRSKTSIRRRSHRPRGCRGGSSRKKRRGGKVPQEIIGATMSVTSANPACENVPRHDHHLQGKVSDENAGGSRAPMGLQLLAPAKNMPLSSNVTSRYGENKQMLPPQRSLDATVFSKVEKTRAHPPVLPPLQKKAFASKTMNSFSTADRSGNRSISSNTTIDSSAMGRTNLLAPPQRQILPPLYRPEEKMQDMNNGPPKQNIYALQPQNHQGHNYNESNYNHDYNDDTFVDSNSNMHYYPDMEYQHGYTTQEPYQHQHQHQNQHHQQNYDNHSNSYGHQIAQLDQQQHYNGNNDYDQNYSINANNNYGFVVPNNSYETDFSGFQGEYHTEPPVSNNSRNSNFGDIRINVNTDNSSRLPVQKVGGANTYYTDRIEKQRQMMAEGGSLFVTSPRSFLMGRKSDDAPRCM